jgi:hypothetical protein
MIQGIQIDLSSEELQRHLSERAEYHADKATMYADQVQALRREGVGQTAQSNDPVHSLQQSERHHRNRAELFGFIADRIIPNETYRVSESDLTRLELIGQYL